MNWLIYDINSGRIEKSVSCSEDMLGYQYNSDTHGCISTPSGVDMHQDYILNGLLVRKPPKPSQYHVFDYALKAWKDPRTLEQLKVYQWGVIKKSRESEELGGFNWRGFVFDSDQISQQRIQGSVQLAQTLTAQGQVFEVDWTLANNSVVTLSGADMISVGLALGQHITSCHSKSRLLRQQIESATTKEELELIVWA